MTAFALSSSTTLFYINKILVDMRESPTRESKVVSQAIFSEKISFIKEEGEWSYITTSDGYAGWVQSNVFIAREKPYETSLKISRLSAHLYASPDIEYGPIKTLPYGSHLQTLETIDSRWIKVTPPDDKECFIQKGDVVPESPLHSKQDLVKLSQRFLGVPYTWGGRSSFGYDCSGFVQMLYHQIEINLPRDSKQQVIDPRFQTIAIQNLEPGDLIFFGKSEQHILHIGMFIGDGQLIHATSRENQPWIRISLLSDFEWSGHPDAYFPYRVARQWKF